MSEKFHDLVSNRKAAFNYELLDTFEAGIVLQGTEIKSLRNNGGALIDSYIKVIDQEAWLIGCHIAPYRFGNVYNHSERRDRKLLLHKREIAQLEVAAQEKGFSLIPLSFYLKNGCVKVRIAIARGKKLHDKRQAIKERDDKKEMSRMMKKYKS
jgi:SsrA-binding protein